MANTSGAKSGRPPFNPDAEIVFTQAPEPSWRPGDGLGDSASARAWKEDEKQGWKMYRPDDNTAL